MRFPFSIDLILSTKTIYGSHKVHQLRLTNPPRFHTGYCPPNRYILLLRRVHKRRTPILGIVSSLQLDSIWLTHAISFFPWKFLCIFHPLYTMYIYVVQGHIFFVKQRTGFPNYVGDQWMEWNLVGIVKGRKIYNFNLSNSWVLESIGHKQWTRTGNNPLL